jgi:hypothetical protein
VEGKPQLIVPYTLDANDMRFAAVQGFNSRDQFYPYLKDSFDTLYAEGSTAAARCRRRPACGCRHGCDEARRLLDLELGD